MKRSITLLERTIEYDLKMSKRAQYVRLTIYPGGRMVAVLPWSLKEEKLERLMRAKAEWIFDKIDYFKRAPEPISGPDSRKDFLKYKTAAHVLVRNRIEYFNPIYQCRFNKITIRNQRTRWGSCSKKSNLSFNYKIALLPRELADYIIVHELCHLKELNHSQKFWDLVGKALPEYRRLKRELRKTK